MLTNQVFIEVQTQQKLSKISQKSQKSEQNGDPMNKNISFDKTLQQIHELSINQDSTNTQPNNKKNH